MYKSYKHISRHKNLYIFTVPDFFEDGLPPPAQAYLKVCSAMSEASLNDVKPSSTPTALGSPRQDTTMPSSGTTVQRRSVLHTEEIVSLSFCNVFKCARDSSQHLFFPAILTYI